MCGWGVRVGRGLLCERCLGIGAIGRQGALLATPEPLAGQHHQRRADDDAANAFGEVLGRPMALALHAILSATHDSVSCSR